MKTCAPGDCLGAGRLCGSDPCAIIRMGRVSGVRYRFTLGGIIPGGMSMAQVTKKQEHELTKPGKDMDLSFLGKPHEHDPRRTYSTTATDWQARVDFDRLRRDRLADRKSVV